MARKDVIFLKLNTALRGHAAGVVVRVKATGKVPHERYWRDRLKDAPIDNCVEIVSGKPKKAPEGGNK